MRMKGLSSVLKIVVSLVLVIIVIVAIGALVNDQTGILTNTGRESTMLNLG